MDSTSWLFDIADHTFMGMALELAREAAETGEVPVGAIVVSRGEVIAGARNARHTHHDVAGHAEILALRKAGLETGDWRLTSSTLYVTLEPCPMCLEACRQARVELIIWGAADPKMGACGSVVDFAEDQRLYPLIAQRGGLRAEESAQILREFFANRRVSS